MPLKCPCRFCGGSLPANSALGGRPRVFCTDGCRVSDQARRAAARPRSARVFVAPAPQREAWQEAQRRSRARRRVIPVARTCQNCGATLPISPAPKRGRRPLYCDAACSRSFRDRRARARRLSASLATSRARLTAIDAEALTFLDQVDAGRSVTAELAALEVRNLRVAAGRAEIFAALALWLNPSGSSPYGVGRPRKGTGGF